MSRLPADDDVEHYEGADGEDDVQEGVEPEDVDVEVPVVAPHVPAHYLQVPMQTVSQELLRDPHGVVVVADCLVVLVRLWTRGRQLEKLWEVEQDRVENNRDYEMSGTVTISTKVCLQ